MRRSLEDLNPKLYWKDYYENLPKELKEFNYFVADTGHVILAIPDELLAQAEANGDLDMFECCMPVKYVLEKGYHIYKNHVIVNAVYDSTLGVVIPNKYYEY
jgi:hypothetical protein